MPTDQTSQRANVADGDVPAVLRGYLSTRLRTEVADDLDLFESGLVTSLFAMELVVHLEQVFGIEVVGPDLRLDNFRTVRAMTALVARLREEPA